MTKRNKLRDELHGFSFDQDRLWRITGPNFVVGLTEYNEEITGFAPLLHKLFKNGRPPYYSAVHYSGNAYYVLNECRRRGWKVEHVEDRR
jgi:hypothetical protein